MYVRFEEELQGMLFSVEVNPILLRLIRRLSYMRLFSSGAMDKNMKENHSGYASCAMKVSGVLGWWVYFS